MVTLLLKKSYRHKDLKEVKFQDLWNSYGVFTTMRVIGKPAKILFFKEHIDNLFRSLKIYKINKKNISNISFDFNIKDKQYFLENGQIEYEKLRVSSKKIKVNDKNQYFLFEGDVSSPKSLVNSNLLTVIFKNNLENIGINNVNFGSENNFSFRLGNKFKFSNFKINSKIDLKKLTYKKRK